MTFESGKLTRLTRRKFIRNGFLLTSGLILADAFWFEKFFIETKEFYLGPATKETRNIKIVQISDLHLQSISYQLKHLANKLNQIKPDLILITGDAIDKAKNISLLNTFLRLVGKEIKKAAILGNWEYWGNVDLTKLDKMYAENNCALLINQTTQYAFKNTTVSITGMDDYIGGNADFATAIKNYIPGNHHIILNHCPQYNDHIAKQISKETPADFILSGHTHGGQINLFGFTPFLPQGSGRYLKGWYEDTFPKVYVSKGIGTSIFPARLGARAEIAVFYLNHQH